VKETRARLQAAAGPGIAALAELVESDQPDAGA